jgi:subtilisin family serine protease
MIPCREALMSRFDLRGAMHTALLVVSSCLLVAMSLSCSAQDASPVAPVQGAVVTLKVSGPLSPEDREALAELIEPEPVTRLIDTASSSGAPLMELCARNDCPALDKLVTNLQASLPAPHVTGLAVATMELNPQVGAPWGESFAVIGRNTSIARAAGLGDAAVAVPTERLKENDLPLKPGQLLIPPRTSRAAVSLIEADLRIGGKSEREVRLNRVLTESEFAERIARLGSSTSVILDAQPPQEAFSFMEFQASGSNCAANPANWPFDMTRVVQVMNFNEAIRRRLKLGPPRRSRILVVDTGLGKQLSRNDAFFRVLFPEPAEMITPAVAQRELAGVPICIDGNNNGYWRDVYGTGSGNEANEEVCVVPSFDHLDLLQPHPRKETSQQIYFPDHGSFVAALAAGGPEFYQAFPAVADFVGLSFFRVTRKSQQKALHVENSADEISRSLEYAKSIGADVINMSLRTNRDAAFQKFKEEGAISLLVAAAGNNKEDLDKTSPGNRPASLRGLDDRMIVVAALQPNKTDPLWPMSARSASHVHIAAPGAQIKSLDAEGQSMCDSGTSAAAPLVSFTAAMLRALTGAPRAIVRARLLAAADHVPELAPFVEEGRRLNIEAALDVFVDRVELADGVKRGWMHPLPEEPFLGVCRSGGAGLQPSGGRIDPALLWHWSRKGNQASIRHQLERLGFEHQPCDIPAGEFSFFDLATRKTTDIQWSDVKKLLPTPFRALKATILNSDSLGAEVGAQ